MQTRCAGCSKVEPKMFDPPQTPSAGARDGQNLISWRWSLPLPTNPLWWESMHAISTYRGNRPTTHTNTTTDKTDYNTLHAPQRIKTRYALEDSGCIRGKRDFILNDSSFCFGLMSFLTPLVTEITTGWGQPIDFSGQRWLQQHERFDFGSTPFDSGSMLFYGRSTSNGRRTAVESKSSALRYHVIAVQGYFFLSSITAAGLFPTIHAHCTLVPG